MTRVVRSLLSLAVICLMVGGTLAHAAGGEEDVKANHRPLFHADFLAWFEDHGEGFTLPYFTVQGEHRGTVFIAPDMQAYLFSRAGGRMAKGELRLVGEFSYCFDYPSAPGPFCWDYFIDGVNRYRAESLVSSSVYLFDFYPGNYFKDQVGEDWAKRFEPATE